MKVPSFSSLLAREFRTLRCDPWLVSLVSWVPLLLFFIVWAIFSQGIATDLPLGVVDLDKSSISRALIRHYDDSPTLKTAYNYPDVRQGATALRSGKIYGLVIIPANLEKRTILGRPPQVTVFINSQFLLIAKIINSALTQAQGTFTAKVEIAKNLAAESPVFEMAFSTAMPIGNQITPLFNINSNYAQFLVFAILPAIWQILMVVTTIVFLAAEQRRNKIGEWLGSYPVRALLAKFLLLTLIFFLHGLIFLSAMYIFLGWPMHGSWTLLIVAQLFTVVASICIASLIFFITQDVVRGLSFAGAYAAPGLAFMGVTFPVSDMTLPARLWRNFIPISHYIEIQFGQVNYGAPLHSAVPQLLYLGIFLIPVLFVFHKSRQLSAAHVEFGVNQ